MKKLFLIIAVMLLLAMTLPIVLTEASVASPYIAVVPQSTMDPVLTPGKNYTVSIFTDYTGADIQSYQFTLSYNSKVLKGISVTNGDLITTQKHPSAQFMPGVFNNTDGKLSSTGAFFFFSAEPAPTTSGPGTLATVTFTVIGTGTSGITLGAETKLIGYSGSGMGDPYNIVDAWVQPNNIGQGYFHNIPGDLDGDRYVGPIDLSMFAAAYGKRKGNAMYNRLADLDGDGYIGPIDLSMFAAHYGKTY